MAIRSLSLALLALGLVGGGGYLLGSMRSAPPVVTPGVESRAALPGHDRERGLSEQDIRRVIRDELDARAARPQTDRAPSLHDIEAPRTADHAAAFDAGVRRIDQARASHQWTPQDAAALDTTLATIDADQRKALLATLMPALNRGEIKLTYRGPLF